MVEAPGMAAKLSHRDVSCQEYGTALDPEISPPLRRDLVRSPQVFLYGYAFRGCLPGREISNLRKSRTDVEWLAW